MLFLILTRRCTGKGGNGCAAFHREKFVPYGPPSGGNGGRGGDVYLLPSAEVTTLASIPKKIRGESGGNGQGTWLNGKNAEPLIIRVPLGTVVRQVPRDDPRRSKDEWEAEEESLNGLDVQQKRDKMRERRWVHYPRATESNLERDSFKNAEYALYKAERQRRIARRTQEMTNPINLDLDKEQVPVDDTDSALGHRRQSTLGHLIASGGLGGLGNPHFLSTENRSPKFATRGHEGEHLTLELELKLLADIGLVGMPNAGKSTLLRALTGGRVKTEIAGYAFTTLNPVVGVVRVAEDGTFEGSLSEETVHDETRLEEEKNRLRMEDGELAYKTTRNKAHAGAGHTFDLVESFRFTIADNPGLISKASENVGLGHSFLKSMERSLALVYVVDFSSPEPWAELKVLRDELEQYQPGMSLGARLVIANKADLLAEEGDPAAVAAAREKLAKLQDFVKNDMEAYDLDNDGARHVLDVIPVSAKYSQNLPKLVTLLQQYVRDARKKLEDSEVRWPRCSTLN